MSGFPLFSNFEPHVRNQFDARKGDNLEVSKYTTWFRLFSGAGSGLIMYSNPDYKLFRAAGDDNIATIYGGQSHSGILGVDWDGHAVHTEFDVPLKPSPIVTSADVDEGMGNISRRANLSITAFTKEQADLLAGYFIEPGFTVFFEWGRNNRDAMRSLIDISRGSEHITREIADMQNFDNLVQKRKKSNGHYDNYLGFIKGGNVTISGDLWNITAELVGFNEIPYYMQVRNVTKKSEDGEDEIEQGLSFDIIASERDLARQRFKIMYNDLPSERRTRDVKGLINNVRLSDLINFDKGVYNKLNAYEGRFIRVRDAVVAPTAQQREFNRGEYNNTFQAFGISGQTLFDNVGSGTTVTDRQGTVWEYVSETERDVFLSRNETANRRFVTFRVKELAESESVRLPRDTKIIDSERFISMRLAMKILELNAESIVLGETGNKVKFSVDIKNTAINGFEHIFSTDRSKLFIPNAKTPAFTLGAATRGERLSLKTIGPNKVNNSIPDIRIRSLGEGRGVLRDIDDSNEFSVVQFPEPFPYAPNGASKLKDSYAWGYLKNLYINFEFFKRTISVKTFVLGDVLKTLLNGLSDAVSSYWDFQIFEREDEDGNMTLQIYDMQMATKTDVKDDDIYEFTLLGDKSIFLQNSFTVDVPGAMANKIIGERLNYNSQGNLTNPGLFTQKEDRLLRHINERTTSALSSGDNTTSEESEELKELTLKTYLGNVGIYPKPNLDEARIDRVGGNRLTFGFANMEIDTYILYATYDDTQLFDNIYHRDTERRVKKNETTDTDTEVSTLLPLTFSFTVHGLTGIKRGDKFRVIGLPKIFTKKAFFQVTSIKQTIDGSTWQTDVEGRLRRSI